MTKIADDFAATRAQQEQLAGPDAKLFALLAERKRLRDAARAASARGDALCVSASGDSAGDERRAAHEESEALYERSMDIDREIDCLKPTTVAGAMALLAYGADEMLLDHALPNYEIGWPAVGYDGIAVLRAFYVLQRLLPEQQKVDLALFRYLPAEMPPDEALGYVESDEREGGAA